MGRVTRGEATWNAQYRMIKSGKAFLVLLRDVKTDRLVWGGQHTQVEGVYAAYDRALLDKPLGYVVQQLAIEHMKSLELGWYRIGERLYLHCNNEVTNKEFNISIFKEGFCSTMKCRFHLIVPSSKH